MEDGACDPYMNVGSTLDKSEFIYAGEQNHASVVKSLQGSQAKYLNLNELQV